MNVTRRQFSKSIFVGTLASGLSGLTGMSDLFAQSTKSTPKPTDEAVLVGVEHGPIIHNTGFHLNPHSHTIEDYATLPSEKTPISALQGLTVLQLHVRTLHIKRTVIAEPLISPSDCITGVIYLADGTLLVAITPDAASEAASHSDIGLSRLLLLNEKKSSGRWEVSGPVPVKNLSQNESLDSLCLLRSGKLIGMVTKKDGTGPSQVVEVDPRMAQVSLQRINLDQIVVTTGGQPSETPRRFSTLAEAPDGRLYTSVFPNDGTTELWILDLKKDNPKKPVSIKLTTPNRCSNQLCAGFIHMPGFVAWYHGIQSLIVTPTGQLLAQCNLEYILPDSLYSINVDTGLMTEIASFPVARATLSNQT